MKLQNKSCTRRRQDENDHENAHAKLFFIVKFLKVSSPLPPPPSSLSWLLRFPKTSFKCGTLASAGGHSKTKVPLTTGRRSKNSSGQLLRLRTAWDKSQFVTKRNKVK